MADLFDFDRPQRYGVMGNPVSHSKSPRIHQLFAEQFGKSIEYRAIQVDVGGFAQAVDQFRANGGHGLNVTVPFKREAFALAEQLSARAKLAGAVNTLTFDGEGHISGDNTDGIGLMRDITVNLGVSLQDKTLLVLGAGGATRGILGTLLEQSPASITIANRTVVKARELAEQFAGQGAVSACGFSDLAGKHFQVVINGTSASLQGEALALPASINIDGALAYDLMYAQAPTTFMRWAHDHGAAYTVDGLGMLVEQAAESFFIWHGQRPQTPAVIAGLRLPN